MKLGLVIFLFILTIYKCELNCANIVPLSSSDCVLSDLDLKNSSNLRYCCYLELYRYKYSSYSNRYIIDKTDKRCVPYNETGYDAMKFKYNHSLNYYSDYNSYEEINNYECNYRSNYNYNNDNNQGEYCDDIEPTKASDCKFSYSESSYNKYCCYVKDSSSIYPYCQSYTKSEVDTITSSISYSYSTAKSVFVCTSSASYIKISILILLSLLL